VPQARTQNPHPFDKKAECLVSKHHQSVLTSIFILFYTFIVSESDAEMKVEAFDLSSIGNIRFAS
jgi:hypothetical protein